MPKKDPHTSEKTSVVRIDSGVARQARIAAEDQGLELSEYLTAILRPQVAKDWARARKKILDA
jgi:predicted HicB family RNase H-like nuclease